MFRGVRLIYVLRKFFALPAGTKAPAKEQTTLALKSSADREDKKNGKKSKETEKASKDETVDTADSITSAKAPKKELVDGDGDNVMNDVDPSTNEENTTEALGKLKVHGTNGQPSNENGENTIEKEDLKQEINTTDGTCSCYYKPAYQN